MASDTAAPVTHDLTATVEDGGFRLTCSCGWSVSRLPSLGGGPIFCGMEGLPHGR